MQRGLWTNDSFRNDVEGTVIKLFRNTNFEPFVDNDRIKKYSGPWKFNMRNGSNGLLEFANGEN